MSIEETVSTPARRSPWPRALAGVGVVAVIGAGLGAYLGIRVVQGAGSGSSAGQPPARTGAAMAFDTANGTVVLFGGSGKSGSLGDTWIWDGSTWTRAHPSTSPPALSGAQMTFDPVSHDLVLVGGDRLEPVPLAGGAVCSSTGSSGSGTATGSTGSTGSGSTRWIPPTNAVPADAPQPSGVHGIPVIPINCGLSGAGNSATWLWNGNDWSKASGTTPSVGFGGWTLATDPVSGRALLFAPQPFMAQPYAPTAPGIACPVQITPTNDTIARPACPRFPIPNTTWTWTGHSWKALKTASNTSIDMFGRSVIDDAVSGRLASFRSSFSILQGSPAKCPTCGAGTPVQVTQPRCCTGSVSLWDGSAWRQSNSWTNGPVLSGGTFVGDPATHSDVYLASNGQTWVWDGAWTRKHPGATPATLDGSAAAFDAANGQVLQFGGFGTTKRASGLYDQTWTWDGSNWNLRAGTSGPAVKIPVPSPVSVPPAIPCEVRPQTSPPVKALPQPQGSCSLARPGGSGGGVGAPGALPGSAGGVATGTGVIAP